MRSDRDAATRCPLARTLEGLVMKKNIIKIVRSIMQRVGLDLVRYQKTASKTSDYSADFSELSIEICDAVKP